MTKKEKDILLHEHLTLLLPAFGKLQVSQARMFIDVANDCLSETPFMYLITGDGVAVVLRKQMLVWTKFMFDKPYGDYSG